MALLHRISVRTYHFAIVLAGLFSGKARKWRQGRQGLFERLEKRVRELEGSKKDWIWIHASSLGEFEQGRPLLERIRAEEPERGICLTFFSPSGYEARKGKGDADIVEYMPLDTRWNAERFVELLRPRLALFVKYDLWYEHLRTLQAKDVPVHLIAAVFRPGHRYFKWYGAFFRRMLGMLDRIHVQNERSRDLLESVGIENGVVSGDPRYDRVRRIADEAGPDPLVERFKGEEPLLVAGSSWPPEEKLLQRFLASSSSDLKLLIAPHDVGEKHIRTILERFADHKPLRYSADPTEAELEVSRVLVVDRIGLLASLYRYGDLALVGGGFSGALHNILEPAAHGLPVYFGPKVLDFPEAIELLAEGCGKALVNDEELHNELSGYLEDPSALTEKAAQVRGFVDKRVGATERIWKTLDLEENSP